MPRVDSNHSARLYWLAAVHFDDATRAAWQAHLAGIPMTWLPIDFFDLKSRRAPLNLPAQDRRKS